MVVGLVAPHAVLVPQLAPEAPPKAALGCFHRPRHWWGEHSHDEFQGVNAWKPRKPVRWKWWMEIDSFSFYDFVAEHLDVLLLKKIHSHINNRMFVQMHSNIISYIYIQIVYYIKLLPCFFQFFVFFPHLPGGENSKSRPLPRAAKSTAAVASVPASETSKAARRAAAKRSLPSPTPLRETSWAAKRAAPKMSLEPSWEEPTPDWENS